MSKSCRDIITARLDVLSALITRLEKKLKDLPSGSLKICKSGNRINYYISGGNSYEKEKYLNKNDFKLIEDLAQKSYLKKVLKASKKEAAALKTTLDKFPEIQAESIYDKLSDDRKKLVKPIVTPIDQYVREWLEKPYEPKEISEDTPIFETLKGERVRSKSEQIIADRLYINGIPYKYECPLKVGKKIIHPDFTILRKSDRKVLYHEHCGKMDDPDYTKRNLPRINDYILNGFALGDKLFLSLESSTSPLDVRVIDRMIKDHYM